MQPLRTWKVIAVIITFIILLSGCSRINYNAKPTPYYERKLKLAVMYDRLEMAKEAVAEGANIDEFETTSYRKEGKNVKNPLAVAFYMSAYDTAEFLIKNGADLNSYRDIDGNTYLTFFSTSRYSRCKRFIPMLLENGADPTITDSQGYTPIEKMLSYSYVSDDYIREFIELMTKYGAEINKNTIKAAYHYYGCKMLPEMTKKLIAEKKETGLSSFEENIILSRSSEVKSVLNKRMLKDYDEEAILNLITAYCDTETLKLGMNNLNKTYSLDSLLITASIAGNLDNVKYLLDLGANINYITKREQTALIWSIINNHYDVAKYLLDKNAKFHLGQSSRAQEGVTNELCSAAMNGNIKMLKLLIDKLGKPEDTDVSLAIQTATIYEQEDVIQFFFDMGYSGELYDYNGLSLLSEVAYYGKYKAVQLLIDHGAKVDGKGDALDNAIEYGNIETVRCLLVNGAEPNIHHLISAVYKDNYEYVKLLVDNGVDVNEVGNDGYPVLFYSVRFSNNILKFLVEKGADINYLVSSGTSPLIYAVNHGMVDNAKYLIKAGADTSIRNKTGKTAYEFALESKYKPMIEMFKEMNVKE